MSLFRKLKIIASLSLVATVVSGVFMEPLVGSGLLGVKLRGFPLAWISQVVYPGALPQVLLQPFLLDFLAWFTVISLVYFVFRKL
jgi:ABC-type Fe3+-siderophore transport system permease subunit